MKTNWLAFYEERKQFRYMMKGLSAATRNSLAFLDTTKAIQNKEGLGSQEAKKKLCQLIEQQEQERAKPPA